MITGPHMRAARNIAIVWQGSERLVDLARSSGIFSRESACNDGVFCKKTFWGLQNSCFCSSFGWDTARNMSDPPAWGRHQF